MKAGEATHPEVNPGDNHPEVHPRDNHPEVNPEGPERVL